MDSDIARHGELSEGVALGQFEKMLALSQFAGGLAHDFNNLLAGIIGNLDMVAVRLAQNDHVSAASYLEGARSASRRAAGLTQRLLGFSGRQQVMPVAIEPAPFLADAAELIRHAIGPHILVATECPEDIWQIHCDQDQLEIALLNLAFNARDAMDNQGRIQLHAANVRHERPTHNKVAIPGDYVAISVIDHGTGMTTHVASRACEPFFSTKVNVKSSGLGLATVFGFAMQSGGDLMFETREGQGTTATLLIPRAE
ncbi:MAG: ATP-binding protein [Acidiphilium sp.]|nr:ATP-binding protein [Acidiphilium sp.]